jgi:hypothetical protein
MSCPSPRTDAPPFLPLDIKDLLKEDTSLLLLFWGFCFLAFGFWMKGGFLMWEVLEGKRIAEGKWIAEGGKRIAEGKRIVKGELIKGNY